MMLLSILTAIRAQKQHVSEISTRVAGSIPIKAMAFFGSTAGLC